MNIAPRMLSQTGNVRLCIENQGTFTRVNDLVTGLAVWTGDLDDPDSLGDLLQAVASHVRRATLDESISRAARD